jgi:O-antigen ligase
MNHYIKILPKLADQFKKSSEFRFKLLTMIAIVFYVFGKHEIANTFIIAMALNWILTKDTPDLLKISLKNPVIWMFLSVFLLTLLGTFYSSDLKTSWKFIEMRLTLLLIPLIIFSTNYSGKTKQQILLTFIITCIITSLSGLTISFFDFLKTGDMGYFYNDNLISFTKNQAVYFALYLNICIVIIYWYLKRNELKNRKFWMTMIPYLTIFIFLLASRISILLSFIIIGYIFYNVLVKKKTWANVLGVVAMLIMTLVILGFIFPKTIKRFQSVASNFHYDFNNPNDVNHFNGEISGENWNGLTLRLALWECGIEVVRENPFFGVGTGDYDYVFHHKIEEKQFIYALKQDFGVHNQYLYFAISFGLIGLVIYIFSASYLIVDAIRERNFLFIAVIGIFLIGFLTENILNRYIGVLAYVLLTTIIYRKR